MVNKEFAVVGNSSSMSRSLMVNDMVVLVSSTMPNNVVNLTFNSFGLIAQCQPVVDCKAVVARFYCPSFSPSYDSSSMDMPSGSKDFSRIDLLDLTSNAVLEFGGYPLDSVLNSYGAQAILYWIDEGTHVTIFPANGTPGWYQRDMDTTFHVYWYTSMCNMTAYNVYCLIVLSMKTIHMCLCPLLSYPISTPHLLSLQCLTMSIRHIWLTI